MFVFLLYSDNILLVNKHSKELDIYLNSIRRKTIISFAVLIIALIVLFIVSLCVGSSNISFIDSLKAIFRIGNPEYINIIYRIRLPRTLGAVVVGASLSLSGLLMQKVLKNELASPSTLGISNAASFGANIGILILSGTGLAGLGNFYITSKNPYLVSIFALLFSVLCLGLVLLFSSFAKFKPTVVILLGIAFSNFFLALTTLLQYFADDVSLSAVTNWSFGNLERLNYAQILIIAIIAIFSLIVSESLSYKYNALDAGESLAKSIGIKTKSLRFISLLLASLMAAVSVCFCGIIGFVGIIAPQSIKRIIKNDMKLLIPSSFLGGALLLLICDIFTRLIGNGTSLPVGAITSLIGVPFFIILLFTKKEAIKWYLKLITSLLVIQKKKY